MYRMKKEMKDKGDKKKVKVLKEKVQHLSQENEWVTSFLKETMNESDKLYEVFMMYSQFLFRYARNEIQLDEINQVEATTSEIFYPKYKVSDLSVTSNQKINEGKRGAIYNLQNGTLIKEESILPTPESVIQDKRINMFHNWKEAFIQYYLSHIMLPKMVPKLAFIKKKNDQSQIRMEKIKGITFYQFILQNINDMKKIVDMWIRIAKILEELQKKLNFVHGDFHAKNVMITEKNEIYLIDFGLCKEYIMSKKAFLEGTSSQSIAIDYYVPKKGFKGYEAFLKGYNEII